MKPQEAFLLVQACNSLQTFLTNDEQAARASLDVFVPNVGESVQAFSYLAVAAASVAGGLVGSSPSEVLDILSREDIELIPSVRVNWEAAVELIRLVARGVPDDVIAATASGMDIATAVNSTFSVAAAAVAYLADNSEKSAAEWLSILRTGSV